ncbi:MAG TPA: aldehyde dehydrogenase [Chitinophagaceae bacterium]|jgi:acyl-CoA reductase-like NAD-dependent aldehyde dehydrogenase|nr:aldehyde dehydrogenase [Chitinophagaceae bacterium]
MQIINPATEEIICEVTEDNTKSLAAKFQLLKNAQREWIATGMDVRVKIIKQFSGYLENQAESLASLLTSEVGKPLQQSRNEINGARTRIKWLAENAEKYLGEELMTRDNDLVEKISYEPLGVICNISAWNYPWLVGVNVFVSALLAGNTVMYKPSEYATLTGLAIEKLFKQAGVPAGVFQVAIGAAEVGNELLKLPFDGYFFTGSYKTGKYIYEKCASKMVPCQLEMGGKDPLYVARDIKDIQSVAAATADGAFYNNGQSCCSVERIYVHEAVYDAYIREFTKEVGSWKTGVPTEEGVYFGPLTRKAQLDVMENQVADAVAKGARLLLGGKRMKRKGYYFEPTILVDVTHEMDVMKEESFGPIIGIMKVRDDEEAIRLMQDTEYGLTAAVYSENKERAENILHQINAGSGYWNCCDRVSAPLPWSGRKHSGFGVTLSHAGLRSFVRPKAWHLRG